MKTPSTWLTSLKVVELHKLAVLLGTPCSGTKTVLIRGIQNALSSLPRVGSIKKAGGNESQGKLSLVSIDMGIRNLAYSHWTAILKPPTTSEPAQYTQPILQAWRKINISTAEGPIASQVNFKEPTKSNNDDEVDTLSVSKKELFEPIDYATHAYNFIRAVIDEHEPSHILIERQRFRSGGHASVQEWTIRVGVFEGMLYAVLKSLIAERAYKNHLLVEPVLPARVNRYWLAGQTRAQTNSEHSPAGVKKSAREVKLTKIELARTLLLGANQGSPVSSFKIDKKVADVVSTFVDKKSKIGTKRTKAGERAVPDISKLDDLSDCLLQGLGWIHWQNNRLKLDALKEDAYARML